MWVLVMALVGYGSNDNKFKVWEKVDWMVYHSDCKYLYQMLLPAMQQFSEPQQQGTSGWDPLYHCLYFEEEERDQNSVGPLKTP